MRYIHLIVSVCLGVVLLVNSQHTRASNYEQSNTEALLGQVRVIVAEDKTSEANCYLSINNGPEKPCPPGSVIWTREITYSEAKTRDITDFVIQSDDPQIRKLIDLLTSRVSRARRDANKSDIQGACQNQPNRKIDGRYSFTTGRTMYYTLTYATDTNCRVYLINDRTKTDGSNLTWTSSCTDAESAINPKCSAHFRSVGGTWSSYYFEENSYIGRQYRHVGGDGFHAAYGYYYFD